MPATAAARPASTASAFKLFFCYAFNYKCFLAADRKLFVCLACWRGCFAEACTTALEFKLAASATAFLTPACGCVAEACRPAADPKLIVGLACACDGPHACVQLRGLQKRLRTSIGVSVKLRITAALRKPARTAFSQAPRNARCLASCTLVRLSQKTSSRRST